MTGLQCTGRNYYCLTVVCIFISGCRDATKTLTRFKRGGIAVNATEHHTVKTLEATHSAVVVCISFIQHQILSFLWHEDTNSFTEHLKNRARLIQDFLIWLFTNLIYWMIFFLQTHEKNKFPCVLRFIYLRVLPKIKLQHSLKMMKFYYNNKT